MAEFLVSKEFQLVDKGLREVLEIKMRRTFAEKLKFQKIGQSIGGEKLNDSNKRKPLEEILSYIEGYDKILVLGCQECPYGCVTSGEDAVKKLAEEIKTK